MAEAYRYLDGVVTQAEGQTITKLLASVHPSYRAYQILADLALLIYANGAFRRATDTSASCLDNRHSPAADVADSISRHEHTATLGLHILSHAIKIGYDQAIVKTQRQVVALHDRHAVSFAGTEYHHAAQQIVTMALLCRTPPGEPHRILGVVMHNSARDVANALELLAADIWSAVERGYF